MGYDLIWTRTLAGMADFGPLLQLKKHCGRCDTWARIDLNEYAAAYGWEFSFWDWEEFCEGCGEELTFLSSPGPGTPLLPMKTDAAVARSLARTTAETELALYAKGWTREGKRWIPPEP